MASLATGGQKPDLTVLIATRDRPESLRQTLQLLSHNDMDSSRFHVIVIDNSAQRTAEHVVSAIRERLSLSYLHQPRPGKGRALNLALQTGTLAPLVAVLDDDMSPGSNWCHELLDFSARWPDAGVFAASSYVIWPDGAQPPDWIRRPAVAMWALSVIEYPKERYTAPGEHLSGNYFWFRRDVVGSRRFRNFTTSQGHFVLGLIEDGTQGVVGPGPRCGHRVQPELLRLEVQQRRAAEIGRALPLVRLDFPRTVPQAAVAARHPIWWRLRSAANLTRWMLVAATSRLRSPARRIPVELVARVGIANNLQCLRFRREQSLGIANPSPGPGDRRTL